MTNLRAGHDIGEGLSDEQRQLAGEHIGLVGMHLRMRVPTPACPTRYRDYDDLFQEGCVALMRAARTYDPKRHGSFAAYALPRIRGAVYEAIYEQFTVVRIPARAREERRLQEGPIGRCPLHVRELSSQVEENMITQQECSAPAPRIRHLIREHYEKAVQQALEQMRQRRWRYRDPCAIMARIASERLLISGEKRRTPLRTLGRDFNVSSGRITDYEKQLLSAAKALLENNPQVQALVAAANELPDGYDAMVDEDVRRRVRHTRVKLFEKRFDGLPPAEQATTLYSLLQHSAESVREIACNLYRLTVDLEDCALREAV